MSASENKAIFLSYASQDVEAARRVCGQTDGVRLLIDHSAAARFAQRLSKVVETGNARKPSRLMRRKRPQRPRRICLGRRGLLSRTATSAKSFGRPARRLFFNNLKNSRKSRGIGIIIGVVHLSPKLERGEPPPGRHGTPRFPILRLGFAKRVHHGEAADKFGFVEESAGHGGNGG